MIFSGSRVPIIISFSTVGAAVDQSVFDIEVFSSGNSAILWFDVDRIVKTGVLVGPRINAAILGTQYLFPFDLRSWFLLL